MSTPNTNTPNPSDAPPSDATIIPPVVPPVEPTPAADDPQATPPAAVPDAKFSQADIDKAIAKALKDSAKKVADAEARAKLSEEERSKAEMDDLRLQIRERDARDAVNTESAKLGVKNAALIYKLVKDELEFDDKGKVSNLAEVFDTAKTDYPDLFDTKPNQSIDAGAGTTGTTSTLTKDKLAKMTPTEINALDWSIVSKILSEK